MQEQVDAPKTKNPLKEQLARVIRIRRFARDIGGFCQYYFGHHDDPVYRSWDDLFFTNKRNMIECPLGHGKSWRITFGQPMHTIVYNRNIRMLVASKKQERAVEFGERIMKELESNQKINEDFGDWAFVKQTLGLPIDDADMSVKGFKDPSQWTKAKFTVQRPKIFREPTLTTSGVGGQIEGLRLDYMIGDDILDIEDRTSEIERERHKEWLRSTFMGRLEPAGTMMLVGTPWHQEDAYAYLEELSKNDATGWYFRRYEALPGWKGPYKPELGIAQLPEPLLPWRWTKEQLLAKYYELGDVEFMAKYQCNPRASEGRWFKESWLKFFDPVEIPDFVNIVMGCDFNNSERTMADYTALVVVGQTADYKYYVLDIFRDHMTDGHAEKIIQMWQRWRPNSIAVEKNGWQRQIYKSLMTIRSDVPAIPVMSAGDKKQRILTLQPLFMQGRVYLNREMPAHVLQAGGMSQSLMPFVNEYSSFPDGKNDDMLDALQMCFDLLGYANSSWSGNGNLGISHMGGIDSFFGQGYA